MSANHVSYDLSQDTVEKEFEIRSRGFDLEERRLNLQERDLARLELVAEKTPPVPEWRQIAAEQTALMTEIRDLLRAAAPDGQILKGAK